MALLITLKFDVTDIYNISMKAMKGQRIEYVERKSTIFTCDIFLVLKTNSEF